MADDTVPVGATNIAAEDKGNVLYQKLLDWDVDLGRAQGSTFYRERLIAPAYTVQSDSVADGLATFWTSTVANGGTTASTGGEGLLQTSTATNGSAQLVSTAPAYHPGQVAWLRAAARFGDTGTAGNIRRIGAFTVSGTTPQEGFAYELDGTTLNAVTYKGGVASATPLVSWNNTDRPFTLDANYHLFELRWTANACLFYIDNELRHSTSPLSSSITNTLNLPMALQNIKTAGATNQVLAVRNIGLGRFGHPPFVTQTVDNYRNTLTFFATGVAAGATGTETLITLTRSGGAGQATTSGTSFAPTAGKRFRILSAVFACRGNATATAQVTTFSIRANSTGATVVGSPQALAMRTATPATALAWDRANAGQYDHGIIEFDGNGTASFGVSANAVYTTNAPTWDVTITAVEYTP